MDIKALLQRYKVQILLISIVLVLTLLLNMTQKIFKKTKPLSLDELIPKSFVLISIEIQNSEDLIKIIGSYGVVDIYTYSPFSGLPENQVAKSLKVIPTQSEDRRFAIMIPEKEVTLFLEHKGPFYAVIQHPKKQGSQILKKRVHKPLQVIEEEPL